MWQQAANEPSGSFPCEDALKLGAQCDYMQWVNKPQEESQCYLTLADFKEVSRRLISNKSLINSKH